METCIFCKISKGEIPSHKIYEDENIFAFLDAHPINPGHILVVTKKHEPNFYDLDIDTYQKLMEVVKSLSVLVNTKIKPKKVGLIVAGWDVSHTHVHIVPMQDYHDITSKSMLEGQRENPTDEELENTAKLILGGSTCKF